MPPEEVEFNLENQRGIFQYISANPGVHLRKLSRDLDMPMGTLRYHLDFLEKKGIIVSKEDKNLKIYFIAGELNARDKIVASLLQQKRFRDIILLIIVRPGITHGDISSRLAIKPSTLSKYIKILEERAVIGHDMNGREKHYHAEDESRVMELLLTYRKTFWDSFVDNIMEMYYER